MNISNINLSCVCVFLLCLSNFFTNVTTQYLRQMKSDLHETQVYFRIGLLSWLMLFVGVHACRHSPLKRVFLANFIFVILKPFLIEIGRQTKAALQEVSTWCNFLVLCILFLFIQEILQNGQNRFKNGQNTTFLNPGGQNMQPRKKA